MAFTASTESEVIMASRKKRKSSSADNGFDLKSLGALLVIIIGVALIIVLVRAMDKKDNVQETGSSESMGASGEDYGQDYDDTVSEVTETEDNEKEEPVESTPVESEPSFTVTVTGLDGSYNRTNVESAKAAKLKVSGQDSEGFEFSLSLPDTNYAGYAEFVSENTAEWTYDGNVLKFECGSKSVTLSGLKAANGKYISGEPTYTDEPESDYDGNIINASATRSKLSDIMSGDDYSLCKKILSEGSKMGVSQSSSEYQTDKNGAGIMVDKETGMIKYQYELKYEGRCMVLCSSDGKVCIGIYNENDDTGELRYYASSSSLRSSVPGCIKNYAIAYGLELVIC